MALGTAVVSTPTDGMKDLISSGVNGYLSDEDEVLADAIENLLRDQTHREAISRAGKERFAQINDADAYKAAIAACYGEIK